jgi:regulator of protease activity HflC (stomatin/prohibitin superfamily)
MDFLSNTGAIGVWTLVAMGVLKGFFTFILKPIVIRTTHKGVHFVGGKTIKILDSGFHWYFPFYSEIDVHPVVRQTTKLPPQALMTLDGEEIAASAVIVYEFIDIEKAFAQSWDIEDTIRDIAMVAVKKVIVKEEAKNLWKNQNRLDNELETELRSGALVKDFGISIFNAYYTDLSKTTVNSYLAEDGVFITPKKK